MGKIIAVILVLVLLVGGFFFKSCNSGTGHGDGNGTGTEPATSESTSIESTDPEEIKVSEIKVEGDKIYFDDKLCTDAEDLREKVTEFGSTRNYIFIHDNGLKGTCDEVRAVLSDLRESLEISVIDE